MGVCGAQAAVFVSALLKRGFTRSPFTYVTPSATSATRARPLKRPL